MHAQVRFSVGLFLGSLLVLSLNTVNACEGLVFSEPWVREPPPVATVAAAYVVIENVGETTLSIDSVSSECCRHLMLHETEIKDGKARMNHLSTLQVKAGSTIRLAPLGAHLMLIKPATPLQHGQEIKMTFSCGPEDTSEIMFPIIKH